MGSFTTTITTDITIMATNTKYLILKVAFSLTVQYEQKFT